MKLILFIICFMSISLSAKSNNFPELVDRVNTMKIVFEDSNLKQLGRIDACKEASIKTNKSNNYKKWVGAREFILTETEIYFVLHVLMSAIINKDQNNATSSILLKPKQSKSYINGYNNFLNSKECFNFKNGSVYSLMNMAVVLLDMSAKQAWDVFKNIYPRKSNQIMFVIKKDWPKTKFFD